MRREDSDQQNEDNIPISEDLDFERISERGSSISGRQITNDDNKSDEEFTGLRDRIISTATMDSISIDSREVSGTPLSNHSRTAIQHVGSASEIVGISDRSVSQQVQLNIVSQGQKEVQTIGTNRYIESLQHEVTNSLQIQEETDTNIDTLRTTQLKTLTAENHSTSNIMTLDQSQTGNRPEQEIKESDPCYHWFGGNPYGSTTPRCVVHINKIDAESLPFIQRVLRDTYTELEGGRPRIKTATAHAGSIRDITIHGAIVTLDLTTEMWTVSTEGQRIQIKYQDQDMLPDLRSIISRLYGGKLGYFILNIDQKDLQSRFIPDEFQELIRTLLPATENYDSDISSNELLQRTADPIQLAVPRYDTPSEFIKIVKSYFCFENINRTRIADIEAEHESRLRANDWRRVALTQQQRSSADESDNHYLWKASISAGIAWRMYEEYSVLEEEISFNNFVETRLIPSGPIQSEEADESSGRVPDIQITTNRTWAWNGVRHYLSATSIEPPRSSPVVFEFETGRSEGAFNFRKFYDTLDKYSEESEVWIYLVVPPQTLFRSERRAKMVKQLVERWVSSAGSDQHAELCVPMLGQYGCERLISAQSLITEWFEDIDD